MSLQRRRGQTARIWKAATYTDNRGHEVYRPDADGPHEIRAVFIPQRSARAEVAGQVQINVVRMLVDAGLPGVNLWSCVEWDGKAWDVVSPPALHHGTRRVRHWSVDLRQRPGG